ncbi:hypothetical protein J6P11_04515 [bacterium]|nr:hypothetical protein [bacterium]MBO6095239.1 hypothetical protein [bacterium]
MLKEASLLVIVILASLAITGLIVIVFEYKVKLSIVTTNIYVLLSKEFTLEIVKVVEFDEFITLVQIPLLVSYFH